MLHFDTSHSHLNGQSRQKDQEEEQLQQLQTRKKSSLHVKKNYSAARISQGSSIDIASQHFSDNLHRKVVPASPSNDSPEPPAPQSTLSAAGAGSAGNNLMINDDSSLVQFLNDRKNGFEWMINKVKYNSLVSKDVCSFLKKRAAIEEEYGKNLAKLSQSMDLSVSTDFDANIGGRSFMECWGELKQTVETLGKTRVEFARETVELSEELVNIHKDTDRSRKQIKESAAKYKKQLYESESQLEKMKAKYDASNQELAKIRADERVKALQSIDQQSQRKNSVLGIFKREKSEDECWGRVNQARDALTEQVEVTRSLQTEFVSKHQPHLLQSLKECGDDADLAVQALLLKHLTQFENVVVGDAELLAPLKRDSVKAHFGAVNFAHDLRCYINHCAAQEPQSEGNEQANLSMITFGQPLDILCMEVDNSIPKVVKVCIDAIGKHGMKTPELYHVKGTSSRVHRLVQILDKSASKTTLADIEWQNDPISIAETLKTFFNMLPDPLLTFNLQHSFLEAAGIPKKKARLMRIHELVNELPDGNYITLRFVSKHLLQVAKSPETAMSISQLSAVFGPIFVGKKDGGDPMGISKLQALVVETILDGFKQIFDD